jgi:hypothetical protein
MGRHDVARDAVAMLAESVRALSSDEVHGRSLGAEIVELERWKAALDAQIARRIAAFDHHGEFVLYGHRSTAGWMVASLRVGRSDSYRRVHCARDVEQLPAVEAAWQSGAISTRHVETITRIRHAAQADVEFAAFEPSIAQVAISGTPDDVANVGRQWRHALDDACHSPADTLAWQQWERRGLRLGELDGLGFVEATLDSGDIAIVRTAIDKERQRLHASGDERSYSQQLADGLVSICRQYLAGLPAGSNHPHLVVAIDLATLAGDAVGLCETEHGIRLAPDTARRIACEANINRVLLNGDAVPLELGRASRYFSVEQRKAMILRDGRCRFPGCRRPPDQCQTHHVVPWERDGNTNIDNGGLVCWEHHRVLHEGKWTIVVDDDLSWTWHTPEGTHHGTTTPRPLPIQLATRRAA